MEEAPKWYDAHLEEYRKVAYINSMEQYQDMYRRSIEDADNFWAEVADEYVSWYKKWDSVLKYDFETAKIEWFGGAELNLSYNCLDRHLPALRTRLLTTGKEIVLLIPESSRIKSSTTRLISSPQL